MLAGDLMLTSLCATRSPPTPPAVIVNHHYGTRTHVTTWYNISPRGAMATQLSGSALTDLAKAATPDIVAAYRRLGAAK
jgi:hypothetical protein